MSNPSRGLHFNQAWYCLAANIVNGIGLCSTSCACCKRARMYCLAWVGQQHRTLLACAIGVWVMKWKASRPDGPGVPGAGQSVAY
ncbi:MAG: hypothetical protein FRX49_09660 [Trebouxia sp. A1-2]|nr:MAG: hypothetical protein FRX49_09660 [Trebouxia sp. A1-2]